MIKNLSNSCSNYRYKSIIKKKKLLLAKTKLAQKFLICKALIDSNISHDEFVLINNVLKESGKMKKQIKHLTT